MWVLGSDAASSEGAAHALSHGAISPVSNFHNFLGSFVLSRLSFFSIPHEFYEAWPHIGEAFYTLIVTPPMLCHLKVSTGKWFGVCGLNASFGWTFPWTYHGWGLASWFSGQMVLFNPWNQLHRVVIWSSRMACAIHMYIRDRMKTYTHTI